MPAHGSDRCPKCKKWNPKIERIVDVPTARRYVLMSCPCGHVWKSYSRYTFRRAEAKR